MQNNQPELPLVHHEQEPDMFYVVFRHWQNHKELLERLENDFMQGTISAQQFDTMYERLESKIVSNYTYLIHVRKV